MNIQCSLLLIDLFNFQFFMMDKEILSYHLDSMNAYIISFLNSVGNQKKKIKNQQRHFFVLKLCAF